HHHSVHAGRLGRRRRRLPCDDGQRALPDEGYRSAGGVDLPAEAGCLETLGVPSPKWRPSQLRHAGSAISGSVVALQTKSQIFNRCDLPCVFTIISFCSPPHSARWCKSIMRQSWPWSRRRPQASLRRSFTDVVWHARRREKQLETFAPRSRTRPSGHCAAMRRSTRCDSSHAQERASDRSRLRPDKSQVAAAGRIEQKEGGLETPSRSS